MAISIEQELHEALGDVSELKAENAKLREYLLKTAVQQQSDHGASWMECAVCEASCSGWNRAQFAHEPSCLTQKTPNA